MNGEYNDNYMEKLEVLIAKEKARLDALKATKRRNYDGYFEYLDMKLGLTWQI